MAHAPEHVLRTHVEAHGGDIASMVPALGQRLGAVPAPTRTDPDTERYLLYGAVAGLLTAASTLQPTVLVLDDLQWSDSQSLRLLRHVVTTVESARLLVLGTFRDTELSPSNPLRDLLGALQREPSISRIELKGFDDTGVLAFMEAAAGQRLEEAATDLAHALYLETEGNPFFVGEVLRSLMETGAIYQDDRGRWTAAGEMSEMVLPNSVREVISARVGRLGAQAGRVLSMAAVIGRDFDFDLLDAVTDLGQEEVLDVLDAASGAALVREVPDVPGRYSFSHALTQHTLYQGLPKVRRTRAHRQVAEAIEATVGQTPGARVGELAHHWLSASQPANATKAIGYARQAGEAALAALAPDDAVRYFSRALHLAEMVPEDDPLVGCDLRLALGEAQRQAGLPGFRETFLDAAHRAQELDATDRLVAAALGNSRGFFSSIGVIDADKVAVLESALDALGDDDGRERALLLATLCSELALGTTLDRRQELADAARAMARRLGDPDTVIRTLNLVCDPLQVPSTLSERMVDAKEALELSELLGDPDLLFWTGAYSRLAAVQAGDFEMARRCLATMHAVIKGLRQPTMMWVTLFNDAADALLTGDPDRAEQLATAALEIGTESGQPDAFGFYGAEMIGVRRQQGRYGELVPLIEQIAAENPALPVFRATLAEGHMEAGNVDTARQMLEAAVRGPHLIALRRRLDLRGGLVRRRCHRTARRGTGSAAPRSARAFRRPSSLHRGDGRKPGGVLLRQPGVGARPLRRGRDALRQGSRAQRQGSDGVRCRRHPPAVGPHALGPRRPRRSRTGPRSPDPSPRRSREPRVRQRRPASHRGVVGTRLTHLEPPRHERSLRVADRCPRSGRKRAAYEQETAGQRCQDQPEMRPGSRGALRPGSPGPHRIRWAVRVSIPAPWD